MDATGIGGTAEKITARVYEQTNKEGIERYRGVWRGSGKESDKTGEKAGRRSQEVGRKTVYNGT